MFNAFISYSHAADDKFAPALQNALQKFAKPWYKKRNLEVFRDESSLSASPHLWNNITRALDNSEYLILLASPGSEKSKWVNKEIEYWLVHKSIDNILIALTDGNLEWDNDNNTFLYAGKNSLPPSLDNKFDSEPFYVDLRFSRTEKDLSLDNPIFKKEVLKLAAKLHGKQPNDLASEEVTTHRRMMQIRNSAIGALILLLMATSIAGFIANENRKKADRNAREANMNAIEARRQEGIAFAEKDSAEKARDYALRQEKMAKLAKDTANIERNNATKQKEIAIEQKNRALANYLVSEAKNVVATNPTLALRLLEKAMLFNSNSSILQAALDIYFNNNFYKSVSETEFSQARLRINIKDTGFIVYPAKSILSTNDAPYLSDFANQKKVNINLQFTSDYSLRISPDQSCIIAYSREGEIKIRRITGRGIEDVKIDSIADFTIKPKQGVTDVKLLLEKKIVLVTEDYATIVRIFNLEGNPMQELKGHNYPVSTVFSTDGSNIYTSSRGYYITEEKPDRKWYVRNSYFRDYDMTGPKIDSKYTDLNHNLKTDGKTISPVGKTYLQNSWSDFHYTMLVSLFDKEGKVIRQFFDPVELVTAVSFSPDGQYVFTGLSNGTARMYNTRGMLLKTFSINLQDEIVYFAFTTDKKNVFICARNGKCRLWEIPMPMEEFLGSNLIEPMSAEQKKHYGIE